MPTIRKGITVMAPSVRIFSMLDDPEAFPRFSPNVAEVSDIHRTDKRVGDTFKATYSILGIRIPETFTYAAYDPPRHMVAGFSGAFNGSMACTLTASGAQTEVALEFQYEMPGGIAGKALNAVLVARMQEQQAEQMLQNIKLLAEIPEEAAGS